MCTITSLAINDYLGGKICRTKVDDTIHYFNLVDGQIIDFTASQFNSTIDYSNYKVIYRNQLLKIKNVEKRYLMLKERLTSKLLNFVDNM